MLWISELNHAASVSAAYASSSALPHSHARLASGRWLAFAGRESNPLDSIERFLSPTSDFLLSQAYPGAISPQHSVLFVHLDPSLPQLPFSLWISGKNTSFQFEGFTLSASVFCMKSANLRKPCGATVKLNCGLLITL